MNFFLTGPTGYIGSAIVRELLSAGHQVSGLVRSDEGFRALEQMGAHPVRGDMKDPATYESHLAGHDVLIHAGADYSPDTAKIDLATIEAFLRAEGASAFLYTSGVWVLGNTGDRPADESASTAGAAAAVAWRPAHEQRVLGAASAKLATAVIRPGIVYGGGSGLVSQFFATAKSDGFASYIGDGKNHWPLVHREDCAALYRLIAEKKQRGLFHAVDGVPTSVLDAARAASEAAGRAGSTRRVPLDEARKRLGPFADAMCLDQRVIAPRAMGLGWTLRFPEFRASAAAVFEEWKRARA